MSANLTDMRLFVAAFEERSFTAAAAREHATQSGVSQHIGRLEARLGVKLFARDKSGVTPTPAAETYYRRCLDVLRATQVAGESLAALSAGLSGEIRVGLMPTMTRSALAPALTRFMAEQPNVAVRIIEAYSGALTRDVKAGVYDFAIVPAFAGGPGLTVRPFLATPETLVARRGSGLKHLQPIKLSGLPALKLVMPEPNNTRRDLLATYFTTNGVRVARTIELDAMMGTLATVAGSEWMSVLPGVMMASELEQADSERSFDVCPIAEPPLDLDLVAIEPARRTLRPAAAAFFDVLEAETRRLNQKWIDVLGRARRPTSRPARRARAR